MAYGEPVPEPSSRLVALPHRGPNGVGRSRPPQATRTRGVRGHAIETWTSSPRRRAQIARLVRYAATSGVAFGVSETTLLLLYGNDVVNATVAAVIANLAGTVPSYFMSRYWIWKDSARTRVGRQVVLYWTTSVVCMAVTSLATGAIASLAPAGHRFHLAVVAVGFPAVTLVFWLAKFVLYQRVIFPGAPRTVGLRK